MYGYLYDKERSDEEGGVFRNKGWLLPSMAAEASSAQNKATR
ncbi:hypothetical protein PRUB_a0948 [Pseudoalteromonas rubra]|uniref:Uncharacterized protein n=1 Tax=Pseudoalteromonas rubra TaxID=43658 RepID=A0A8T0C8V2_9GAMM|nr:hypothetical protein PRUB_a0948 [Pseudoalteromonas rubra]